MSATLRQERSVASGRAAGSAPAAVSVNHVSKTFRLPHEQFHTLKERVLHPFRSSSYDELRAVDDVSIEIPAGEFFGIVGRNGSGKSTLLKCLAGIYEIDGGELSIEGRLSPFIELGVGFNPDLTARDNVIINAIMLGLSRKEARERFPDVVAFAELEEFLDLKLKNYSSGMQVRLAFATAVQVDADILLIDEVLAVGDAAFQQKCFDELIRLRNAGRTMLFVTHDMGAVQRFCDRAMLLDRGRVVDIGEPLSIARQYNELNFARIRAETGQPTLEGEAKPGDTVAEVLNAWFESPHGEIIQALFQGDECHVRMDVGFLAAVEDPVFGITLQSEHGYAAFATSTNAQEIVTGRFEPGTRASIELGFDNVLAPGRYRLIATVAAAGPGAQVFDTNADSSIIVHPGRPGGGMADLPHTLAVKRSQS